MLIGTLHGIYCDPNIAEPARLNAFDVCQQLAGQFSAQVKADLVNRHSEYAAKGDENRHAASLQFFERLGMLILLNELERHAIFYRALVRLWNVHTAMNNFYNEPAFAERLLELSKQGAIPETIQESFVVVVACCAVGNQYGVSWAASNSYGQIIKALSPREISILMTIAANKDSVLGRRLNSYQKCRLEFKKALLTIDAQSVPSTARGVYDYFTA